RADAGDVLATQLRQRVAAVLRVGIDLDLPAEKLGVEISRRGRIACRKVRPDRLVRYRCLGVCHKQPPLQPRAIGTCVPRGRARSKRRESAWGTPPLCHLQIKAALRFAPSWEMN